jgi:hypothetical protein
MPCGACTNSRCTSHHLAFLVAILGRHLLLLLILLLLGLVTTLLLVLCLGVALLGLLSTFFELVAKLLVGLKLPF